jgi:hypothetical protein
MLWCMLVFALGQDSAASCTSNVVISNLELIFYAPLCDLVQRHANGVKSDSNPPGFAPWGSTAPGTK